MKKGASEYNSCVVCENYKRKYKEDSCHSILMTYTAYHTRNGIVSIISCSHQSTEGKHFMMLGGSRWERF